MQTLPGLLPHQFADGFGDEAGGFVATHVLDQFETHDADQEHDDDARKHQEYREDAPGSGFLNPFFDDDAAGRLLGGFFFQTCGIGNLYAGNVGVGIGVMLGYWLLTAINVAP